MLQTKIREKKYPAGAGQKEKLFSFSLCDTVPDILICINSEDDILQRQ